MLTGEFAIPFIGLLRHVSFIKYETLISKYHFIARHMSIKARCRGCQLLLPLDVMIGDEMIPDTLKNKCYDDYDIDARDDGADFEGEAVVVRLTAVEEEVEDLGSVRGVVLSVVFV